MLSAYFNKNVKCNFDCNRKKQWKLRELLNFNSFFFIKNYGGDID